MSIEKSVERSHDKSLRTLARHFVRDFIEILFPDVADEIDFDTAKFVAEKLFADFRKKGHVRPDVVVELSAKSGEKQLVLFHAEMENRFVRSFEKRLLVYKHQLALEYGDECPILSAVIYRLGGPKTGIEQREIVVQFRGFVTSRTYYMAFSLSRSLAEEYVDRPQDVVGALAAMMGSNVWDRVEQKLQCYEAIRRAEVDDEKRYLLIDTVDNYLELSENDEERFAAQVRQEEHEEIDEMIRTYSEALAEHEARGEARGMALGEARGKLEATREAILLLAKSRYDSLPTNFESRLRTIEDLDRLHEVLERISETGRTELL